MNRLGSVVCRRTAVLGMLVVALVLSSVFAASAGAVLVRFGNGQIAGVTPARGVNPASIPGSFARAKGASGLSSNGNLDYHGGPILHATSPYLIFWDPGNQFSGSFKLLLARYFADTSADSGKATDVFGVDRQFTDSTGFANYDQSFSASHVITDTQPYPTTGQCTENAGFTETACLFDAQIQAEVSRLIAADGLPTGITGSAPIYFVVTPPTVNSCEPGNTSCADNTFCAYHSGYADSGAGAVVLYANIPTILAANNPKSCQDDGNGTVQSPNADPLADVTIKYMSHEFNESTTDPLGNAWWDSTGGNEDGDNCNFQGSFDPTGGSNPDAFLPTLGGSETAGTLFDQLINGDQYYTQTEWSNGDVNCEAQPNGSAISAAFTAPTVVSTGESANFDPSASSTAAGYTSTTWNFGDGNTAFTRLAPASTSHAFTAPGTYQVSLTLVDTDGNLSTISHQVTTPIPAFSPTPSSPLVGSVVTFDGSGSNEPGGAISSYSWNFGDGSATATGATPAHTYASAGTYTVTLTVTDSTAHTASISHVVSVHGPPSAAFAVTTAKPVAGAPVSFDGSGSSEAGGTIASYTWSFGDGSAAGTGAAPTHVYAHAGTYTVALTVTDGLGATAATSKAVTVVGSPAAAIAVTTRHPVPGSPVSLSGAGSTDTGSSIVSYSWSFGARATGSGATVSHKFKKPGHYIVTLTVADASGATSTASVTLTVKQLPITVVSVRTGPKIERLKLKIIGAGTLKVDNEKFKIKRAETVLVTFGLNSAQRNRLRHHHSVTIRLKLKFSPKHGRSFTETVKIKIKG